MKVATEIGFAPPVLVEASPLTVNNEDLERKLGNMDVMMSIRVRGKWGGGGGGGGGDGSLVPRPKCT